jgi:hypothetical protein
VIITTTPTKQLQRRSNHSVQTRLTLYTSSRTPVFQPGLLRLVEGLVFPVGLVLIVLVGAELLTSDIMILLLGVIKGRVPWWGAPLNYFVVCEWAVLWKRNRLLVDRGAEHRVLRYSLG